MHGLSLCTAMVQPLLVFLLSAKIACAQQSAIAVFTTTMTSTTTVLTSTVTITAKSSTFATVTTETTAVSETEVLTSDASQPTATSSMAISSAFQSAVLNSTNYYRAQYQANALTWDSKLAEYAQNYSHQCVFLHSGGPYGENLAEGFSSVATSVDAWANEENEYDYADPKFSEATGHFTQLVWKNTTTVGCGITLCTNHNENGANGLYLVCEYSPAGNVAGEFRQEVTKSGESKSGELGFGSGASTVSSRKEFLGALAAACVVSAMLL